MVKVASKCVIVRNIVLIARCLPGQILRVKSQTNAQTTGRCFFGSIPSTETKHNRFRIWWGLSFRFQESIGIKGIRVGSEERFVVRDSPAFHYINTGSTEGKNEEPMHQIFAKIVVPICTNG